MGNYSRELDVCLSAIRQAGSVIMEMYHSFEKIADAPADISTEADRKSQELIFKSLHSAFPSDRLCGEESTPGFENRAGGGGRLWIVDPIDGTRGFARKNDEFSVMIALVEGGEPVVGAVFEPAIDRLTYAERGEGCYWTQAKSPPMRCKVTSTQKLADCVMSISRSQKEAGRQKLIQGFGTRDAVETYSAGIKLAQVARGETDLYLGDYLTLKDWDVCAGHILVEEARGWVTSVDGERIRYLGTGGSLKGRGILSTNTKVHEACLAVLREGRYSFT